MKIAVIGAGVAGVTTAYELARDGHEVTVLDRRLAAAEESSFAIAGLIAPGYLASGAAPGLASPLLSHFLGGHAATHFGRALSLSDLRWLWRNRRATQSPEHATRQNALLQLARYSRDQLERTSHDLQLDFERSAGHLVLLRRDKERPPLQPWLDTLREAGVPFREISPEQTRQLEPGLSDQTTLHGAIQLPDDETGNCRQFVLQLKHEAQRLGVNFRFSATVEKLETAQGVHVHVAGETLPTAFDAAVLCTGVDSDRLLRPLGIRIPLLPVYGYSVSAPLREPLDAPRGAITDERHKVVITRLGQRIRVAGAAEIGTRPDAVRPRAVQALYKALQDWFPGAASLSAGVQVWKGAHPLLPDHAPVLGASGVPGLWLNLGHGAHGWSLGSGSARTLADLVRQKMPDVDVSLMGIDRLRR